MPKEFDACVTDLKAQGKSEDRAYAICTSSFMHAYGMTPQHAVDHPEEFRTAKEKKKTELGGDVMKLADANDLVFFGEISKVDHENRMVYGYATTDALDNQDEIVTKEATSAALEEYSKWRNIREMHQASAVGTAPLLQTTEKGLYIGAKIVDDNAWKKVAEGVYKGFSIGGKRVEDEPYYDEKLKKNVNKVTKYKLNEISLVDRPANPEAIFSVAKRDASEDIEKKVENDIEKHVWSEVEIGQFPDTSFALINRNEAGKTVARALPYRDAVGVISLPNLKVAVSRFGSVKGFARAQLETGKATLYQAASSVGMAIVHNAMVISDEVSEAATSKDDLKKEEKPPEVQAPIQKLDDAKPVEKLEPKVEPPVEKKEEPKVETVSLSKAEYDELMKAKENLAKKDVLEKELLKKIEELEPKEKNVVSKSDDEAMKEKMKKMSLGELAIESGFMRL